LGLLVVKPCEPRKMLSVKERRTDPLRLQFHILEGLRTSVNQELEITANAPRQLESPELETERERCEVTEDELGARRVAFESRPHTQMEVEGTIERWGSPEVKMMVAVTVGTSEDMSAVNLQIPEVPKVTNELENLFVITLRTLHFQGLQGPQKRSEVFFHLWEKRDHIQSTNIEAPEVREGAKVLDVGLQVLCEECNSGIGD